MEYVTLDTNTLWRIRLFDGPILENASGMEIRRFRSQRVGALLAYLALHLGHPCAREEIYEALWPDEDTALTANRLRVALASLRRQLEPLGIAFGTVIDVSNTRRICLRAETVWCDVAAFERAWKLGHKEEAAYLAQGTLLPGYYDTWILTVRNRFEVLRDDLGKIASQRDESSRHGRVEMAAAPSSFERPRQLLPRYLTRFFGRETEQQHLREMIIANRLVTLNGPGGIGKTRIAVETAQRLDFSCVFVPLADLSDADRIPEVTLQVLLIAPQANADLVQQISVFLMQHGPCLLIFDNAEHLLTPMITLVLRLLEAVPELHILITSRQSLEISGETILSILPLEPPPHASAPARLAEFPAIALFMDRAQNVRPDFKLISRHVEALVDICLRLEGMPLALELAAARVLFQTPAQIAASLAKSLMDLQSRQRGFSERHRSLRAAIQGSYDLLAPEIKEFFEALSVFRGGWTARAARVVTGCAEAEMYLEELVVRSLVTVREDIRSGVMRYFYLETMRQFAAERLSASEAVEQSYVERHAAYFFLLAAPAWEDDMRNLIPLDAEQENLLTALEWGRRTRSETYWHALIGFLIHAFTRGHQRVALPWVEEALALLPTITTAAIRFRVRYATSLILADVGRYEESNRLADDMKADAEANGDPIGVIIGSAKIAYAAHHWGEYARATQIMREALQQARSLENVKNTFVLNQCFSLAIMTRSDYGHALGMETEAGQALLQEAEALGKEFLALLTPYSRFLSTSELMLASTLLYQYKYDQGYLFLKAAQKTACAYHKSPVLMFSFFFECITARQMGFSEHAALFFGAFLHLREQMGYDLADGTQWVQNVREDLEAHFGAETLDSLLRRGRQTSFEELSNLWLPAELFAERQSALMARD